MMTKNKLKRNNGFTLVETLVAISILSISIAATFTAVQNGIQNSTEARDQTVAFFLAQEAVEYIKNMRDQNALNSINGGANNWLTGISDLASDPCYFGKVCRVDAITQNTSYCGMAFDTCSVLNQNSTSGLFSYTSGSGWNTTVFKRELRFREVVPNEEVEITVRMSWSSRWGTKSFQITALVFNRQ